ncbi:hypothetical protein [Corynebacterium sp.]|nr:hypothetical protein [Corynebacterium sp.]MDO5032278.1 hypothetical protein [Corynebacterium sp.]
MAASAGAIIGYITATISSLVSLGLSSFGVYSFLLETGHMAPIASIEGLF